MTAAIQISATEPTALLKDFSEFTTYLTHHPVILATAREFIGGRDLWALNEAMSEPVPETTTRTRQTLYPQLHLFYHLALAGELFHKVPGKGGKLILEATDRLAQYEELKLTERYFFLLETFWVDCDWKKLQSGHGVRLDPPYEVPPVMELLSEPAAAKKKKKWKDIFARSLSSLEYLVLHLAAFGFWRVELDRETKGRSKHDIRFKRIELTEFGATLAPILAGERDFLHWNLPTRRQAFGEWKAKPGDPLDEKRVSICRLVTGAKTRLEKKSPEIYGGRADEPFYQPFEPLVDMEELKRGLPRKRIEFKDGIYCFNVALKKNLWRRIETAGGHTLEDLHHAIQEAYGFDDDHLYAFFMDGEFWSDDKFTSPHDEEGPHVDETQIGELDLSEGQRMLYLFDYGDQWLFQIAVEAIRKSRARPHKPKVVGQKGKAPEQYEYY